MVLRLVTSTPGIEKKSCPGDGDPSHRRRFQSFFRYCRVEITIFPEAFTLLPDECTSTCIQLAFSGCVLLLCRFVAVRSFFEGAVLAKPPSPSLNVAPPVFSRRLWLVLPYSHVYAMFGSLPFFVFCFEVQKKKKSAALLSGAYGLVQGYLPRFPQSLFKVYAVYFERSTLLFCTFLLLLCRTVHD